VTRVRDRLRKKSQPNDSIARNNSGRRQYWWRCILFHSRWTKRVARRCLNPTRREEKTDPLNSTAQNTLAISSSADEILQLGKLWLEYQEIWQDVWKVPAQSDQDYQNRLEDEVCKTIWGICNITGNRECLGDELYVRMRDINNIEQLGPFCLHVMALAVYPIFP
jgi:hypothetical protein